ncbi:DUF932 domain-containing protein [Rhodococcus sp. NCIMB 12038]|uniref:DUF932 domain-containing protein n=1 Tax=Rhodococcus sp. NCIMB 12038 TaxID=933800 RepID=UPI000B3D0E4C|nr:DUF932 domain-containing protein [Rhodococcus sp. NCIMB 12038]OUS95059.1 hypothetical protein CA951_13355 [Rhodococcus sp. NCIMB 12038]
MRIEQARQALSLVEETADEFTETLRHLFSVMVRDRQWCEFLDAWHPMPEQAGRARTIATRVREELVEMYRSDARAGLWRGTVFGVVQAVNTWAHHMQSVKGAPRAERNQEGGAISGRFDKLDAAVVSTLGRSSRPDPTRQITARTRSPGCGPFGCDGAVTWCSVMLWGCDPPAVGADDLCGWGRREVHGAA